LDFTGWLDLVALPTMMITASKITSGEDHALRRGGASGTGKNRLSKYAIDVRSEVLKEVCWGGSRVSVLDYEPFPPVNFGEDHVLGRGGASGTGKIRLSI
jgi:hypothetical protein